VETVRNTRILEIAATLPDARKAQALAQFLAESTVELNRSMVAQSAQDLLQGIERQAGEIRARLQQTEARWAQLVASEPVDGLQAAMEETAGLRATVREQVLSLELETADAADRARQAAARARLEQMHKQIESLDHEYSEREKLLALRLAHRDRLEAQRNSAREALTVIEARLREARGDAGYRGERLEIVDPGTVPERPSSPNLPLNLAAAVLLGLVLPVLYLTLEMSYREQRAGQR
jgi:capsule polysaccharide export protein KpsE/RkpR